MSHRKFERPRHGSLGFLPRKRCQRLRGKIKAFPKEDPSASPHLTGFIGFKAGMSHVVREIERPGSKLNKKDIVEAVTIVECPPLVCVGLVGYVETPHGRKALTSVFSAHISEECKRRYYKNFYKSKKKAFSRYVKNFNESKLDVGLKRMENFCQSIRAICHTQPTKTSLSTKKAHIIELKINGGSISEKIAFGVKLFENQIPVSAIFQEGESVDCIGITKGKGVKGVVKRYGVTRLPRKTHRGLRKVACIGAWHPARVRYQIPRHGQCGYHHRTELHKRIYRVGEASDPANASTVTDITEKTITPMGGFPHYGVIKNDFLILKGCIVGTKKRPITLRKTLFPQTSRKSLEALNLKFIDTSAKWGHGRFQTSAEKQLFYGPRKVVAAA